MPNHNRHKSLHLININPVCKHKNETCSPKCHILENVTESTGKGGCQILHHRPHTQIQGHKCKRSVCTSKNILLANCQLNVPFPPCESTLKKNIYNIFISGSENQELCCVLFVNVYLVILFCQCQWFLSVGNTVKYS